MGSKQRMDPHDDDGAIPGKIFIGGLARDVTFGLPRGFGFITYSDPSVVDKVIEETHVLNGKRVEIKRTIPKGSGHLNDFKTKKIFVGGIPSSVTDDELKDFFSKYGNVVEHEIIRDHMTNRSCGFGFVIFDSEEVVDEMLSEGHMIDLAGSQVEIKKAEPTKPSNPPPTSGYGRNNRASSFNDGFGGGYGGGSYGGFDGGYGPGLYRTPGGLDGRFGGGYGHGAGGGGSEFGGGYGGYVGSGFGGYRGESSFGYSGRYGPYGGYGANSFGGYGRGSEGYGGYGGSGYGGGHDSGPGSAYGGSDGMYGRGGYSGGRYHPYAR